MALTCSAALLLYSGAQWAEACRTLKGRSSKRGCWAEPSRRIQQQALKWAVTRSHPRLWPAGSTGRTGKRGLITRRALNSGEISFKSKPRLSTPGAAWSNAIAARNLDYLTLQRLCVRDFGEP